MKNTTIVPSSPTFSKAKPLASRIGVSAKTLFRWADSGLIGRHKVNARIVLFNTVEVENFVLKARVA
jgi:predicted site-specific integrase-resolvase